MHPNCKPDDPSIDDSEYLLRRIPPEHIDDNGRITDAAFDDFYCSVEREKLSTPEKCLAHIFHEGFKEKHENRVCKKFLKAGWKVVRIVVAIPRQFDQTIYPEHRIVVQGKEIECDAHTIICGEKDNDEFLFELAEKC